MLADLKRAKQRLEIEVELKRNSATSAGLDHVTTAEEKVVEAAVRISAENLRPGFPYGKTEPEGLAPPHKTTAGIWKLTIVTATLVLVFITTWMFLRNRPGAPGAVAAIRSLAILPFENLSHHPEQGFFADGMTDALITTLEQISSLKVISRDSVMRYKGTRKPLPDIAKELNVDGIVEGAVIRSGERVRVDAQLIEASTDRHFWGKTYVRNLSDMIALQNEVAQAITNEIQVKLTTGEEARLLRTESVDPQAHEFYVKGVYFWGLRNYGDETLRKSIDYFQQAIQRYPKYALAYAGLANANFELTDLSPEEKCSKSKDMARIALQMDKGLAEAHTALARSFECDRDWASAEMEFQRAIELNPGYATAHQWYATLLKILGRQNWGAEAKLAGELDPLSRVNAWGFWYLYSGQYDLFLETTRKKLELDPNNPNNARIYNRALARVYTLKGMYPEAIAILQKTVDLGEAPLALSALGYTYAVSGKRNEALKTLHQLTLLSNRRKVSPYDIARVYVGLGEKDRAFDWLQKSEAEHSIDIGDLRMSKEMESIRSDPRYAELLRRRGLPP
jgi:TolB-like protein